LNLYFYKTINYIESVNLEDKIVSTASSLVLGIGVGLVSGAPLLDLAVAAASIALVAIMVTGSSMDSLLVGISISFLMINIIMASGYKLAAVTGGVIILLVELLIFNRAIKMMLATVLTVAAVIFTRLITGLPYIIFIVAMAIAIYTAALNAWRRGKHETVSNNYLLAASLAIEIIALLAAFMHLITPAVVIDAAIPAALAMIGSRQSLLKIGAPLLVFAASIPLGIAQYVALTQLMVALGFRKTTYNKGLEPPRSWLHAWLNGRYYIDGIVAAGGFSYVLRGLDERGSVYAIKVLKEKDSRGNPLASNPNIIQSFKREMSNYLLIDSPRIVKVYEVHIPPDEELPYKDLEQYLRDPPYIVMEYMKGGSLRHYLRERGRLSVEEAIYIAREIALALQELHSMGRLHLDLKPENILFGEDHGVVKIGDLGASKIATGGYLLVSQFSATYAAPEVLRGRQATDRSDIYSLGLIMYEMLTGINPQAYRLSNASPPIINLRDLGVPPNMEILIMRCLDPDPMRRPTIIDVVNSLSG
jgi:serine/threonine-protein kinase